MDIALSEKELHMMRHALGLNSWQNPKKKKGKLQAYRNRYAASNPSAECQMWQSLCERGLAESYRNDGSMIFFSVTESGIRELEKVINEQIEETP
jgi:hypothetical protein